MPTCNAILPPTVRSQRPGLLAPRPRLWPFDSCCFLPESDGSKHRTEGPAVGGLVENPGGVRVYSGRSYGPLPDKTAGTLAGCGRLLEDVLVDIEVRVHLLDVIKILYLVHHPQVLQRFLPFELDSVLG